VEGSRQRIQQVRDRADVILVPVRQHHAAHRVPAAREKIEARVVDVDPEIGGGEADAAVDDHDPIALLDGEAVHPDLTEPAQRDEPHAGRRAHRFVFGALHVGSSLLQQSIGLFTSWLQWSSGGVEGAGVGTNLWIAWDEIREFLCAGSQVFTLNGNAHAKS
jgi:hypothetical protein